MTKRLLIITTVLAGLLGLAALLGQAVTQAEEIPAPMGESLAQEATPAPSPTFAPLIDPRNGQILMSYRGGFQGTVIEPPREIDDFRAPSTRGDEFVLSREGGNILLVYFGYMTCPDVCPTTMSDMRLAYNALGRPENVRLVFITVDPERDTLDRMTRYVAAFDETFIGVRPESEEQLNALAADFGVSFERREVDSALEYVMDHSASVLMIGPDGKLVSQYPYGVSHTEISHDVQLVLDYLQPRGRFISTGGEVTAPPDPAREYRIVIPEGTADLIAAGQDPGIIPLEIALTIGVRDVLVLENHDEVDYLVGGIWVAPYETVSKQFYEPQTFVGLCTATVGRDLVEIVVSLPEE